MGDQDSPLTASLPGHGVEDVAARPGQLLDSQLSDPLDLDRGNVRWAEVVDELDVEKSVVDRNVDGSPFGAPKLRFVVVDLEVTLHLHIEPTLSRTHEVHLREVERHPVVAPRVLVVQGSPVQEGFVDVPVRWPFGYYEEFRGLGVEIDVW